MKIVVSNKRLKVYGWIALSYLAFCLFGDFMRHPETFAKRAWNNVWLLSYLTVLNFILFEYTLPYIKISFSRILAGIFLLWIHLMLYAFGLYGWRALGINLHLYFPLIFHSSTMKGVETHVQYSIASVFFYGVVKHFYDHRQLSLSAQQLRLEKKEAELNYLKAQTNPHFLFNTLNNIYSLAREKSDLAPESIMRLSKILRFMLYETSGSFIAIEEELKIMSDYIALEKLRYDESLHVNFNYDLEDPKQSLPPLLLIPLVENAFKHGVSETRSRPFVDIHLLVKKKQLRFVVKNSTDLSASSDHIRENIGLSNLRRQLELLYTDFKLTVHQESEQFTATLNINLSSHV
ncbi:MAG: histidine kinase [Bacteroidota bacterium]